MLIYHTILTGNSLKIDMNLFPAFAIFIIVSQS